MSVLIDTNVLLRSVQPSHTLHDSAVCAIASLIDEGDALVLMPQIVAEFWVAATRPVEQNGLGFSQDQAQAEIARMESFLTLLTESVEVYGEWKQLLLTYGVSGVKAHDARLVAAMKVYGIARILTFNVDDFKRYKDIQIIRPT